MSKGSLLRLQLSEDRYEMRLSGSGGQGMMLAATILAEAIGADPAKRVIQTKSYGPEARGGASKADIVVSSSEIYYPKALQLDLLLAMTQESLDKYYSDLKAGGTLILDESLVHNPPPDDFYGVPFTRLAREEAGNVMVANMIALGAIAAISGVVPTEALTEAVLARAPRGTEDTNKRAVEIGVREGEAVKARRLQGAPNMTQTPSAPEEAPIEVPGIVFPRCQFEH
ncbi:MAG TPA: 2-oxoacid:acceptor oxidoreductase family protein [Candidatus Hydrogenedentes bacterium]|nr:2-oxoacid:acceptor oxidoreductase family protein [Candidatus Hydrogenedentota bacterium]HNT87617.1 2-oxoacid:acceptor oxidoreductase family protein [Candidatus Hydrogenedentota bacterium]